MYVKLYTYTYKMHVSNVFLTSSSDEEESTQEDDVSQETVDSSYNKASILQKIEDGDIPGVLMEIRDSAIELPLIGDDEMFGDCFCEPGVLCSKKNHAISVLIQAVEKEKRSVIYRYHCNAPNPYVCSRDLVLALEPQSTPFALVINDNLITTLHEDSEFDVPLFGYHLPFMRLDNPNHDLILKCIHIENDVFVAIKNKDPTFSTSINGVELLSAHGSLNVI